MGALPEEVRRRPLLGPQEGQGLGLGAPEEWGLGAAMTRDTLGVRPRGKISRDLLNPEIQGAFSTLLGVPGQHTAPPSLPPRVSGLPGRPCRHTSVLSFTHANRQGHTTLTNATPTPCTQITSLTQVHKSSVPRPSQPHLPTHTP